jgi:hypothetical protein
LELKRMHTRRSWGRSLVGAFGVVAVVALRLVAATPASGATGQISQAVADVYLVQGVDFDGQTGPDVGSIVTVCSGDAALAPNFSYGSVIGPVRMTSGKDVSLQLYRGSEVDCASPGDAELLVDQTVTPDGAAMAFVLTSPPGDVTAHELAKFPLDVACHQPGEGSVTVAHASPVDVVYVQVDGVPLGQLSYGESVTEPLAEGTYKVDLLLASDGSSGIPMFPSDIAAGVATVFFVVGPGSLPDGSASPAVLIDTDIHLAACPLATPTPAAGPPPATAAQPAFTG